MKMDFLFIAFALLFVFAENSWSSAKAKWKITDGNLVRFSVDGSKEEEINLESWKRSGSGGYPRREVTAEVSNAGDFALVRRFESDFVDHMPSTTITATFYDSNGKAIWTRHAVREDRLSDDGRIAVLVISTPEGCSIEEGPTCTESIVTVDQRGHELARIGPFSSVGAWWSSRNLRFAGATVRPLKSIKTKYIFFSTETGRAGAEFAALPGVPKLENDGTVDFIRTSYSPSSVRSPAKAVGSETVKSIHLRK